VDRSEHHLAAGLQRRIELGQATPDEVRAILARVPALARDAFVDRALSLEPAPDDGPELPRGGVPYLPCPVDTLCRVLEQAQVDSRDVFVDVGSGAGRTAALVQLLTGATVHGIEVQRRLLEASLDLMKRLRLHRFSATWGDAAAKAECLAQGDVFFMYCPFGGSRLETLLGSLARVARTKDIRLCCVDLPLPPCAWLTPVTPSGSEFVVYRSTPPRHLA
jgi:protein-L-isoaspartate O-methyltransferase